MRVAVIGAGAAGMATAYYLAQSHEVVVYEKQRVPGGNICTLGLNVFSDTLPPSTIIDNGVIEFPADSSPYLSNLLDELGVETEIITGGSTSLYLQDGRQYHTLGSVLSSPHFSQKFAYTCALLSLSPEILKICWKSFNTKASGSLDTILGQGPVSSWIRMLMMYGYSMSYRDVRDFPLSMALSTLRKLGPGTRWMRIKGGVYTYIQQILRHNINLHTAVEDIEITRLPEGVLVVSGEQIEEFDLIVIATPPHEVLGLLVDPSAKEQGLFGNWRSNHAKTIIHTDTSLYDSWQPLKFTEFDLFDLGNGDAGYNAYLNRLAGLSTDSVNQYFLAYNMESLIDPKQVIHSQHHVTPLYRSGLPRTEILEHSGEKRTYFSGAYLYDGLHEGAIQSAFYTADRILRDY